jgi:1,4-alpha-glucan branching enzyme
MKEDRMDRSSKKETKFGRPLKPDHLAARPVFFRLRAPQATKVAIVGDFNRWDPNAHILEQRQDGVWWGTVPLIPGTYQYKFVVDEKEWREDPLCPDRVPNEFGGVNSICEVSRGEP